MGEEKNIFQKIFEVKKANITLQRDTKAFNYKYATLDQIQKKLGNEIINNGLLIIHNVMDNKVVTRIVNIDNPTEFVESSIEMSCGTKPQDKGSEITYYRRYNLLSLFDLEVEDDDGKKAQDSKIELPWFGDENLKSLQELVKSGKKMSLAQVKLKYRIANKYLSVLAEIGIT